MSLLQRTLDEIESRLPGYEVSVEIVRDPEDCSEFQSVNVHMRFDDDSAAEVLEKLCDEYWLNLSPEDRVAIHIGRCLLE